jgi:hypothetical protein
LDAQAHALRPALPHRFYNKATGVLGEAYEKKTDMAMCDELGPKGAHYLQDFIMEKANTSLCKAEAPFTGCSEKEKKFIGKVSFFLTIHVHTNGLFSLDISLPFSLDMCVPPSQLVSSCTVCVDTV